MKPDTSVSIISNLGQSKAFGKQALPSGEQNKERTSEPNGKSNSVFSNERKLSFSQFVVPEGLKLNFRNKMDGLNFLKLLPDEAAPIVFFDPQYRGLLDKMNYGNEGETRGKERSKLPQMSEAIIQDFLKETYRVLMPSGHLFLWVDKFHICQGITQWLKGTSFYLVDMIVWNKLRLGMGYRTRRTSEFLVVLQTKPKRAKGIWQIHDIPDVWEERLEGKKNHTHAKPVGLQQMLITSVSSEGDIVVDPAAGSFSVMTAAKEAGRNFLGCDIRG